MDKDRRDSRDSRDLRDARRAEAGDLAALKRAFDNNVAIHGIRRVAEALLPGIAGGLPQSTTEDFDRLARILALANEGVVAILADYVAVRHSSMGHLDEEIRDAISSQPVHADMVVRSGPFERDAVPAPGLEGEAQDRLVAEVRDELFGRLDRGEIDTSALDDLPGSLLDAWRRSGRVTIIGGPPGTTGSGGDIRIEAGPPAMDSEGFVAWFPCTETTPDGSIACSRERGHPGAHRFYRF